MGPPLKPLNRGGFCFYSNPSNSPNDKSKIKIATKIRIPLTVTFVNSLFPIKDPTIPELIAKIPNT